MFKRMSAVQGMASGGLLTAELMEVPTELPAMEYLSQTLNRPDWLWSIRLGAAAVVILLAVLYGYYIRKFK